MSGPKIYVYPADTWGCGCYRLIWACQVLRAQGHDVTVIPPNDRGRSFGGELDSTDDNRLTAVTQIPPDADVIVMQRVVLRQLAQAVPMLRAKGIAVVVDMDDDLTTIHPGNIAFTALHPVRGRNRYYSWTNAEQACRDATYVTVSTQPLLQVYAPHGRGQVLLNRIPAKYTDIVRHDSEVIGWGGSVHSHPDDLQTLGPAMARLLREGHRFRGIGAPDGIRQALGLEEEPDSFGAVDIREWPWALASLGVGIAPLAESQFNRAKSWLKPLEMSACGVPWVASPRPEYSALHQAGAGVMADRPRDWYRQLKALASSPGRRAELSEAGRDVAAGHTIEGHAWRWLEAWSRALELQRRGARQPTSVFAASR